MITTKGLLVVIFRSGEQMISQFKTDIMKISKYIRGVTKKYIFFYNSSKDGKVLFIVYSFSIKEIKEIKKMKKIKEIVVSKKNE